MSIRIATSIVIALVLIAGQSASAGDAPLGAYVGGGVNGVVQGNAAGEILVGYWWENFAVQGGFGATKTKLDIDPDEGDDFEVNDDLTFGVGLAGKAGIPMGRAKPYLGFGLRYQFADFKAADVDSDQFMLVPSLGIDVRVADNIMLGLVLISVPVIVAGDFERDSGAGFGALDFKGDYEGYEVQVLSSFSVSFLF